MPIERANDPRAFQAFLQEKLDEDSDSLLLEDYLDLWHYENQDEVERKATLEAIREGLADVEAGRTRPAREALAELRRKHQPQGPQ
ncbi:hypothetical protein [Tautonia marina]|uniref:hypothetical protein n=1 Tax=Tautonia marina TaxID=2653855 RepID=UPI0012611646|nr:hypothetical protein [Tautonia marina]